MSMTLREKCIKLVAATRLDIWDILIGDLEAFANEIDAEAYKRGRNEALEEAATRIDSHLFGASPALNIHMLGDVIRKLKDSP